MGADADAIRAPLKDPESLGNTHKASNQILDHDPVSAYLGMVSQKDNDSYGSIYRKWRGHPAAKNGWDQEPWGTAEDKRIYDELHGTEFFKIDAGAERLTALASAADAMKTAVTGMQGRLQNAWHGDAADAAAGQFDSLAKAVQAYHDTLTTLSTALGSASGAGWPPVYANGWRQDGSTAFADQAPEPMTIAEPSTQIDRINYRLYTEHSYTIEQLKQVSTCDLNSGDGAFSDTWWSDETIRGLDRMCDDYSSSIRWFRERLKTAHQAVKDAWTTLNGQLTGLRDGGDIDPFAKLTMPEGKPGTGKDQDPGLGDQQPPPGITDPNRVDPNIVEHQQPPPGDQQPPPGQTTPSQTDPGQPVPGQPTPGQGGKESVTIQDGDRTITVDSEDGSGHVHLSVDDGSGKPKDYDLDFDAGQGQGTGQAGDQGSFNGDLAGGQDGKVTIHDGSTTITAERDGGDGGISLTVDDGSGHPTHYDVDFDDQSGTQDTPGNPDQAQQPAPQHQDTTASSHSPDTGGGSGDSSASGGGGGGSGDGASGGGAGGGAGDSSGGTGADGNPGTSGQESHQPGAVTGAAPQSGNQGAQPAVAPAAAAGPGQPAGGMGGGGMPMMGGMGGGQGGGGDQERGASQWRTEGNLFTDPDPAERFDGVIGDDAPNRK